MLCNSYDVMYIYMYSSDYDVMVTMATNYYHDVWLPWQLIFPMTQWLHFLARLEVCQMCSCCQ